jgi:hypothetical protein
MAAASCSFRLAEGVVRISIRSVLASVSIAIAAKQVIVCKPAISIASRQCPDNVLICIRYQCQLRKKLRATCDQNTPTAVARVAAEPEAPRRAPGRYPPSTACSPRTHRSPDRFGPSVAPRGSAAPPRRVQTPHIFRDGVPSPVAELPKEPIGLQPLRCRCVACGRGIATPWPCPRVVVHHARPHGIEHSVRSLADSCLFPPRWPCSSPERHALRGDGCG